MAFRKIRAGLVNGDVEQFVGEPGNIFYDVSDGSLRLSDGSTPGGVAISSGSGGGSYTLPTATTTVKGGVKIDGTTISISEGVISGFSGSYTDLSNKPTIPSNTNQLTNGAGYITSSSLPTAISDLTNDSGFLTEAEFDLNTINYDSNNNLHATGILPGDTDGFTAVFAGRAAGVAALPNTVIQSQAQVNDYAQNNFQNTSDGAHSSTEWVATSPNGSDTAYYIDMGINGASWDGTATNSLYTNVGQRDGWLYVQGGNAGGGNLVLGTSSTGTYTKIIAGDAPTGDREVARFSSTEVKLKKQLTFNDNTTQTTAWTGTFSYNSLTDKPTLVTSYNDLTDLPTLITSYNELANLPTLFSGAYADLTGKPTLFSGSYNDLTDKPSAPTINLNDLTDVDLSTPPTIGQVLKYDGTKWSAGTDATSGGAGTDADTLDGFDSTYFLNYNNFTNKPTIPTTVTVNGTAITLGSSGTVTANTTNALTIGRGLTGTSSTFDGSAANTISLDTSVTAVTATAGATTTLSAATLTRYYQVTGTLSGTHIFRLPDLTTLTAGQQITFFTSQGIITYQLSTGTQIVSNSIATARQTTFTVVSNAANTTANVSYTQLVSGLNGTGTSLLTNIGPSISTAYITGLDSTVNTTAYASTPTLGIGPTSTAFNTTLNMYTAALTATWSKTINFGTNLNGGTSTINIGTGVTSGTATVNIGSSTSTVQMNGAVTITSLTATNSIVGSITGNAATATKLGTARTINNVSFDGSESITVTANTTNALTIGSGLSGTSFNGSTAVTIAVDSTVALRADTTYIGTTSIALNRSSASQTLTGVSIDGNAATVTNGLYSTGSYANPAWITSLAYSKISGAPTVPVNVSQLVNDSGYITSTSSLVNGASSVSLASDGILTFPSNTINTGTNPATLYSNSSSSLQWVATDFLPSGGAISTVTAGDSAVDITLITGIPNVATTSVNWTFNNDGTISFPDGTTQYSAYSGDSSTTEALTIGTGLSGTSFNGSTAVTIALDDNYGDTKNPYASKTAKYFLASPNAANGAPTFRAIVASDIPTLNQNTTGSAATLTTARSINGVSFNGSADITVTAAAGTLTGNTLASGVTASSLTSVGTLTNLSVTNTITGSVSGNAGTVTNGVYTTDTGTVTNTMLAGSIANNKLANSSITINGSSTALGGSVTISTITGNAGTATKLATARAINGVDFDGSAAITVTAAAGTLTGNTLASGVTASSLTSVGTLTGVTSNAATAFIAGDAAISGVALQMPREGALRNNYNGANNNMYFDVSTGGTAQGIFQFRSSNAFTNVLTMSPTAFNVNPDAVVTARTPSFGRTAWNAAIDTELTIDDYRFRVSNQGGIFPQVISNVSGQTKNSAWTVVATRSGSAIAQGGSTGTLVPNNSWTSLYTFAGMDSAGDTYVATLQDKNQGRIYRVTFIRSDNGSTTGYNIIAERLL